MIFITNHKVKPVSAPEKNKEEVSGIEFEDLSEHDHAHGLNKVDGFNSDLKNRFTFIKIPFSTYVKIDNFIRQPIFGQTVQYTFNFINPDGRIPDLETHHFDTTTYYHEQPYCRLACSKVHAMMSLSDKTSEVPVKNKGCFQELTKSPVHDSMSHETDNTFNNPCPSPIVAKIQVPVVLGEYDMEICLEETTLIDKGIVSIMDVSKEVILTNCKFLPTSFSPSLDQTNRIASSGILFVEGYIQEGIEYIPAINREMKPPREWLKKVFYQIEQKTMIDLKIQLLQIQQVKASDTNYK
ncbi:MAG: BC_2427 family protein [Bacillota bacterium]